MDAAGLHGPHTGPGGIAAHAFREGEVDGDDHLRVPGEDLFERHLRQPAARLVGDVAGAEESERLDIDRAAEPRLEATRSAGVINRGSLLGSDPGDAAADRRHGRLAPGCERLGAFAAARQAAEDAIALGDRAETAIEQRIGDAGLALHPLGEFDIGAPRGARIDDQIGLELEHGFEIGAVAAPGDAADLGPVADARQQEFALLGPVGAGPAQQQIGRERVELDRGGRPGGKDARDGGGDGDVAARAVAHARRLRQAGARREGGEAGQEGAAVRTGHGRAPLAGCAGSDAA